MEITHNPYQIDALKIQYKHFLTLVDLFETRQTWTFNFAILVYVGGFTALAPLLEKVVIPAIRSGGRTPEGNLAIGASSIIYSIALPLIMLPLCYLYVDVSVFCAALNAGLLPQFREKLQQFGGLDFGDPGLRAIEWIEMQLQTVER